MLKKDIEYLIIDDNQLLEILEKTYDINIRRKLISLYNDIENTDLLGRIKIPKDSEIAKFIINRTETIKEDLSLNIVLEALGRSIYEFNHNIKNRLLDYYRKLMDTLIKGQDESVIYEIIRNDKEVYNYIKMYSNYDEYIESMIKKRMTKKENIKIKQEDKKSKSYVMI